MPSFGNTAHSDDKKFPLHPKIPNAYVGDATNTVPQIRWHAEMVAKELNIQLNYLVLIGLNGD